MWPIFKRSPGDSKAQLSWETTVLILSAQSVVHAIGITWELVRNTGVRASPRPTRVCLLTHLFLMLELAFSPHPSQLVSKEAGERRPRLWSREVAPWWADSPHGNRRRKNTFGSERPSKMEANWARAVASRPSHWPAESLLQREGGHVISPKWFPGSYSCFRS